ncbi:25863_t:CDS:2, partial [Gigaspora rosea]
KSPLFLLLAVDNKMTDKYENWEKGDGNENFKEFMKQNDKWWENDDNCKLMSHSREIERYELNEKIEKLKSEEVRNQKIEASQLFKPSNFRLSKKYYFMYLAELVASRTNCMSRKVGCVLVKDEYRVIATGYNGTPKGTKNWIEGNCKSCKGEDKNYCKCIHAEENALMIAGMEAEGCTLYVL